MKLLNLGCGNNFSTDESWTNVDFISTGKNVLKHDLLKGVPFVDNFFDFVYHSHVLEHFPKREGEEFLKECYRVLKPGGIIRIAVPDLEKIVLNYLMFMRQGLAEDSEYTRKNYEWTLIELYDQCVRNVSGGYMKSYLTQDKIINESFVFERLGQEAKSIKNHFFSTKEKSEYSDLSPSGLIGFFRGIKKRIKKMVLKRLNISESLIEIGRFRVSGEVHLWMYDRYSLKNLMVMLNFCEVKITDAYSSYLTNWQEYKLDSDGGIIRKPDSLFIEAKKPRFE